MTVRIRRLSLYVLAILVVLTGCSTAPASTPATAPTPPAPPTTPAPEAAMEMLDELPVSARRHGDDYHRDAFGSDWVDTDHNGCNQRDDVLLRDAVPGSTRVQTQGSCDHDVLAGTWIDPYAGRTIELDDLKAMHQAMAIQIDHVVPLSEAWSSGASGWTSARRIRFANDLRNLLAVDGPTNQSKGDDDPAAWRPRKAFQCSYAIGWIVTKHRYRLAVDQPEANALRELLGSC